MPAAVDGAVFCLETSGFGVLRAQVGDHRGLQRFVQRRGIAVVLRGLLHPLQSRAGIRGSRPRERKLLGEILDLAIDQLVSLRDVAQVVGRPIGRDGFLGAANAPAHLLDAIAQPAGRTGGDLGLGRALVVQVGFGDRGRNPRRVGGILRAVADFEHIGQPATADHEPVLEFVDQPGRPGIFRAVGLPPEQRQHRLADALGQ